MSVFSRQTDAENFLLCHYTASRARSHLLSVQELPVGGFHSCRPHENIEIMQNVDDADTPQPTPLFECFRGQQMQKKAFFPVMSLRESSQRHYGSKTMMPCSSTRKQFFLCEFAVSQIRCPDVLRKKSMSLCIAYRRVLGSIH